MTTSTQNFRIYTFMPIMICVWRLIAAFEVFPTLGSSFEGLTRRCSERLPAVRLHSNDENTLTSIGVRSR